MAQHSKRSKKYRKESRNGPKYQIDNSKRDLKEKINKEEARKPETINLDDYEDFD